MKKTFLIWMILVVICSACGVEENNGAGSQDISFQVSDHISLSENDITVSEGTISEERTSFDTASGEESGTGENPVTDNTEETNYYDWYAEPDPQATFMLRVEGNISENQAWVDFLKGEVPDYTGIDFTSGRYTHLGRPYILQDMEGYSLDLWAYGVSNTFVADGGQLTSIQIFPYDIDMDEEEELLFICSSYAGMVKLWFLDEIYEDTWCLYPSISNWASPGMPGRIWLWSDGIFYFQEPSDHIMENENCPEELNHMENCPDRIWFFQIGEGFIFTLECNRYWSSDSIAVYYYTYKEADEYITVQVMFDRNAEVIDGSLVYAENVCTGPEYDEDLAIITRIYKETVGDAVPVRELTGLEGTEDGVIIVTREEFYSGAYLE